MPAHFDDSTETGASSNDCADRGSDCAKSPESGPAVKTSGYPSREEIIVLQKLYPSNPLLNPDLILTSTADVMQVIALDADSRGKGAYVPTLKHTGILLSAVCSSENDAGFSYKECPIGRLSSVNREVF